MKILSFLFILIPFFLLAQSPLNNHCVDAITLNTYDSYSYENTYKGSIANADSEKHNQDVFFKFVATSRLFTIISVYSEFDADVYLYEECSGRLVLNASSQPAKNIETLIPFFPLTIGKTYHVVVANFDKEKTLTPNFAINIYNNFSSSQTPNTIKPDSIKDFFGWDNDTYLSKFKGIDYDNDGDLDLFTGPSILINDTGSFNEQIIYLKQSQVTLPGGINGEFLFLSINKIYKILSIEDVNKDGNIDLFLWNIGDKYIEIYSNVNTEHKNWFYETPMNINNDNVDKLTLLDYDLDGYKDYVIGNDIGFKVYRNSGDFRDNATVLYEYNYSGPVKEAGTSDLITADFNNDGIMDFFNGISIFYRTKKGFEKEDKIKYKDYVLSIKNTTITDFNNDNIVEISGEIEYNKEFVPYKGVTIDQNNIEFHDYYSIDNIDYDNDGKLEKISSDADGVFYDENSPKNNLYTPLSVDFTQSLVKYVGDIDKNGTSEIIVYNPKRDILFKPSFDSVNTVPQAPTELNYEIKDHSIVFTWNKGSDQETSSNLLTYNLVLVSNNNKELLEEELESDSLGALSNISSLYGTVLATDIDTTGTLLVENIQVSNMGTQTSFVFNPVIELYQLQAYIFTIDKGGLISSNYSHVSVDENYKLFSVNEKPIIDSSEYSQIQLVDINSDKKWDVSMNERLYGNDNSYLGGSANWYSQSNTFSLPQSNSLQSNFMSDFGDFDNDGEIDLLNIDNDKNVVSIYINDSSIFSESYNQVFAQKHDQSNNVITYQKSIFEDYDSDGDLDCIIANNDTNDKYKVLKNKEGIVISENEIALKILHFFDYDQNGEKDAICFRNVNNRYYLELWKRKGTNFSFKQKLIELSDFSIQNPYFKFESIDIDADGVFELIFHEVDLSRTTIFKKNTFGNYNVQLSKERIVLLDYDNDGLVDYYDFSKNLQLYKNYGNWNFVGNSAFDFVDFLYTGNELVDENKAIKINAQSIDFDGDSIVDILFSTNKGFNFYKNNSLSKNIMPSVPINLAAFAFEDTVGLTWDKSIDPNNENSGLSYNVQIWNKETWKYITPIHSQKDGSLLLPNKYTTNTNKYILRELPDGIYYWKVQSIDQTHLPSVFSVIDSFTVNLIPEITLQVDTVCKGNTSIITFDPPSKYYQWNIKGGEIIDSSDTEIKVNWKNEGKQIVTLTNTKFNLVVNDSLLVLSNPIPTIKIASLNSNKPLDITFFTDSTLAYDSILWLIENINYDLKHPIHHFTTHGTYDATVNMTYKNGCTNTKNQSIDIFNPKIIGESKTCTGDTTIYKIEPIGYTYNWDVKGGVVIKEYNDSIQVHWNSVTNQLKKSIEVKNIELNQTNLMIVQVNQSPTALFKIPENIGINSWISFENQSFNANSYHWDFDELDNTSIEQNPTAIFNNIGQHTIILKAFTNENCQSEYQEFISVSSEIAPILISNFLTPNEDGANDLLKIKNIERYPDNTVTLYNSWGREVFKKDSYDNSWDLRLDGEYIPSGQYLCKVKLNKSEQKFEQIITILK